MEDPLVGRVLVGRARLDTWIEDGGSGRVYRGTWLQTGAPAAFKLMWGEDAGAERSRVRFRREAEALGRAAHPGVVELLGAFESGALVGLATAWIEGGNLGARVAGRGPLSEDELRALGAAVAGALAHVHAQGLLHRDLKPENLLLGEEGPRLVDFGLALASEEAGPRLTEHGTVVGTPAFVAPEQVLGEPLDARTDLYGLGAVLWFAAAGRAPFEGPAMSVLQRVVAEAAPPLGAHAAVAPSLAALVDQLLERDPELRPRSALEVQERLSSTRSSLPASPSGPGWGRWGLVGAAASAIVLASAWVALNSTLEPSTRPVVSMVATSSTPPPRESPRSGLLDASKPAPAEQERAEQERALPERAEPERAEPERVEPERVEQEGAVLERALPERAVQAPQPPRRSAPTPRPRRVRRAAPPREKPKPAAPVPEARPAETRPARAQAEPARVDASALVRRYAEVGRRLERVGGSELRRSLLERHRKLPLQAALRDEARRPALLQALEKLEVEARD